MAKISNEDSNNLKYKADLIRTSEIISFFVGLSVFLFIVLFSDFITFKWLHIGTLNPKIVKTSIIFMSLQIWFQYIQNNYFVSLNGLSKQIFPNIITTFSSLLKGILIIVLFKIYGGDLRIYFFINLLLTLITLLVFRYHLFNIFNKIKGFYNKDLIFKHKKFAIQIIFYSIVLTIAAQFDKFIISSQLPIKELGYYSLYFTLANSISIFGSALITAYYPNLVKFTELDNDRFSNYYLRMSSLLSFSILPLVLFVGLFGSDILLFWTHDNILYTNSKYIIFILSLTSYFTIIINLPVNFSLAKSEMKTTIYGQLIILLLTLIPTYLLIKYFTLTGAAIGSFINVLLYYFFLSPKVHNKQNFFLQKKWLLNTSIIPLIFSFPIILFTFILLKYFIITLVNKILLSVLSLILTYIFIFFKHKNEFFTKD
jgi:O-antigen/teichoic acid export membrane protein